MCQALIEMLEDERKAGEKIGEKRGEKIGIKRAEDRYIRNLMKSMNLTEEQAAAALNIKRDYKSKILPKRAGKSRNWKNKSGF